MKLSRVIISNLATFPPVEDMHTAPGVFFPAKHEGEINIFIGPNGSGKSVFLDILQQLWSVVFFRPYTCELRVLDSLDTANTQQLIRQDEVQIHHLHANRKGKNKPSFLYVTCTLNQKDRDCMKFVFDHQEEINKLIATYSHETFRFSYTGLEYDIMQAESFTWKVQIDTNSNQAWQLRQNNHELDNFFYDYCTYFHLIQHCIAIHNYIRKGDDQHWHILRSTFAMIGSYRDLSHFSDTYMVGQSDHSTLKQNMYDTAISSIKMAQDHVIGLLYVQKKIAHYLHAASPHAHAFEIEGLLKNFPLYVSIQQFCKKYLQRNFVVYRDGETSNYIFALEDDIGSQSSLDTLSAGEKSMFGMLCTVYGFHLEHGMLIIDEPELHLHPQLQKQFLALLEELSHEFSLQIIMTTHSSLMVNDRNIKNVYRFSTYQGVTSIVTPGENYNEDTSKLMQILKFTNTAKIFFVKKIIMVEGETDEYAFGFYLQYLAKNNKERGHTIKDYEIVNINGKGGYARWKKFLNTFGIESYFIGDWDNIQETGSRGIDMGYYSHQVLQKRHEGFMSKSEKYKAIIQYLKKTAPEKRSEIYETIHALYKKHVFILQQGDIEAYFGMVEKGLEETVQFIENDFSTWLTDIRFDDERYELEHIFKTIFSTDIGVM